ncbi:DEAD/DEAH box helicase [Kitasatospora terrestris]|uniref:DEAD/DEAH box helicase n=1 Tax=Kitasatospora terrestris TaxID=258051 RepID=A0ABP9DWJ2_9ACTN
MLETLSTERGRSDRLTHTEHLPAREARYAPWPTAIRTEIVAAAAGLGVGLPWAHQAEAMDLAKNGQSVVIATGTASGKSLGYLAPVLSDLLDGTEAPNGRGATALYLAPTKALAADQRRRAAELVPPRVRVALYDGDTPPEEREWVRQYASYVLTNPDMLHRGILPAHPRWSTFLKALKYVVVDECHSYRGVFGSHVAQVLRRLRRLAARYGASPTFLLASATTAEPAVTARRLTGVPATAVTDDASPRGPMVFALWEPPLTENVGEHGAPVRRTATAEAGYLLTDLVGAGTRTVVFVRSRRAAELVALQAQDQLGSPLAARVAAYRGGYLAEERRALERELHSGRLLGLASTSALELGVDVSGLDAVLLAGYPGTRASLWQQAGRAGREAQGALAVLIARDDPLDTYLVHHPEALFANPVEATVLDPDNPHVLAPHLCAAAAELPLTDSDLELFGPSTAQLLPVLERRGLLRRRPDGSWYWTRRERAADRVDLRGSGGSPVQIVEADTGRLLGTVDAAASHTTVHTGAVHLHQGRTYLVRDLDLDASVALVALADPPYTTSARDITSISVLSTDTTEEWGEATLSFGSVEVVNQVVGYLRKRIATGEILGESKLDLPPRTLRTRAVWWSVTEDQLLDADIPLDLLPGAAHAAEHALIGLLPLFATCDRWDIGGVSVPLHPDTGLPTVFVYDGHSGGAGFAERGFRRAVEWLTATRDAISACECERGCPSCVQSPKCGNGNDPLDKAAAVRLLDILLAGAPRPQGPPSGAKARNGQDTGANDAPDEDHARDAGDAPDPSDARGGSDDPDRSGTRGGSDDPDRSGAPDRSGDAVGTGESGGAGAAPAAPGTDAGPAAPDPAGPGTG